MPTRKLYTDGQEKRKEKKNVYKASKGKKKKTKK